MYSFESMYLKNSNSIERTKMSKIVTAMFFCFFTATAFAQSQPLVCNSNVKCNDKNDVVSKLRAAWVKANSPSEPAKSYADYCYSAMQTVQSYQFPQPTDLIAAQLNQCNQGVALVEKIKR